MNKVFARQIKIRSFLIYSLVFVMVLGLICWFLYAKGLIRTTADVTIQPISTTFVTDSANIIRLVPMPLAGNSNNQLAIKYSKDAQNNIRNSDVYQIVSQKAILLNSVKGFLADIIYIGDVENPRWLAVFTDGSSTITMLQTTKDLSKIWQNDSNIYNLICPNKQCPKWKSTTINNELLSTDPFPLKKYLTISRNYPSGPMLTTDGFSSLLLNTGPAGTCSVSNISFSNNYLFYGGECPLDRAYMKKVPIARDKEGKIISIDTKAAQKMEDKNKDWSNRMVRAVLAKEDYLIVSGEGWIGKTNSTDTKKNEWKYPVWNENNTGSYLYANGIITANNYIIVYGFDKAKINTKVNQSVAIFKVSNDGGESFTSLETNLHMLISKDLKLAGEDYLIENLSFNPQSGKIYFVCSIKNLKNGVQRYSLESLDLSIVKLWMASK